MSVPWDWFHESRRLERMAQRDLPPEADRRQEVALSIWRQEQDYDQTECDRTTWEAIVDAHAEVDANRSVKRYDRLRRRLRPLRDDHAAPDDLALLLAAEELAELVRQRLNSYRALRFSTRKALCELQRRLDELAGS